MEENNQAKQFQWLTTKNLIIAGLVVVILGLLCVFYFYEKRKYVWTNDAQIEGYFVNLAPDVSARIITLEVDEGDYVQEGQLISQLDDTILLSKRDRAVANVAAMENNVNVNLAHFEKVRNDYFRAKKAINDQIISPQDYDHNEKDFLMAEALYKQSQSELELARKEVEVLNTMLMHTVVVAPRNGYIAKRWVLQGDVMDMGQTMFTLYDLENIWILARLEETKMKNVKIGNDVEISIDAYPGYKFTGKVYVVKAAAASQFTLIPQNNATGNYTKVEQRIPLKITIEKPANFPKDKPLYLLPGMSAEVKIKVR